MAIAPTNPSATNVLVTSMGSLLFLFLCPQVNEGRSALVPMEQEAVFFCLFCACSDGTSKGGGLFLSVFRLDFPNASALCIGTHGRSYLRTHPGAAGFS